MGLLDIMQAIEGRTDAIVTITTDDRHNFTYRLSKAIRGRQQSVEVFVIAEDMEGQQPETIVTHVCSAAHILFSALRNSDAQPVVEMSANESRESVIMTEEKLT